MRWLVDWFTLLGFPLTLFGVVWAVVTSSGAKSAAQAAEEAVVGTQRQLQSSLLLTTLPQLNRIALKLDQAIATDHAVLAESALDDWRHYAGLLSGMLDEAKITGDETLLKLLRLSVGLATKSTEVMLERDASAATTVGDCCRKSSAKIRDCCVEANRLAGKMSFSINRLEAPNGTE